MTDAPEPTPLTDADWNRLRADVEHARRLGLKTVRVDMRRSPLVLYDRPEPIRAPEPISDRHLENRTVTP